MTRIFSRTLALWREVRGDVEHLVRFGTNKEKGVDKRGPGQCFRVSALHWTGLPATL